MEPKTFDELNLDGRLKEYLQTMDLKPLSPVEANAIPFLLEKKGVVVVSPTGTGKTFSYVLPIVNDLITEEKDGTIAVVVVPTAVLGYQVQTVLRQFLEGLKLRKRAVFFTSPSQIHTCQKSPSIALVTPTLFKELRKGLDLKNLSRIIFDEGDMMLFDGFMEELTDACNSFPNAQKSFFSASLAEQYLTGVKKMCKADKVTDLSFGKVNGNNIKHILVDRRGFDNAQSLVKLLESDYCKDGQGIIFASSKEAVFEASKALKTAGIDYIFLTGSLDKKDIEKNVKAFQRGEKKILLASDYASRGLDLPAVNFVISYDLPKMNDYYFHRAGRTGRFDRPGTSYVLYSPEDQTKVRNLQRRGAGFTFMAVKKDGVSEVNSKPRSKFEKGNNQEEYITKAINKAKYKYPKGKVKPGYKKKIKTAIAIAKNKHKKKIIRTNLAKKDLTHGV